MKIPDELQVFVDSIYARINPDPTTELFKVTVDQLTERERQNLLPQIVADQCLSCGTNGCQGENLTFWRESGSEELIVWHGKRECIPVSSMLQGLLNNVDSLLNTPRGEELNTIKNMVDKVRQPVDESNQDER